MDKMLSAAILSEKIMGREVQEHPEMAYILYQTNILHPKWLVVDNRGYIQFFVKNGYLDGVKNLFKILKVDIDIVESTNTTSVKVYDDNKKLIRHIDQFQKYLEYIQDFEGLRAV